MSWRRVIATDAPKPPAPPPRPDPENIRVPPCVRVPREANHAPPRLTMWGTGLIVSTLLTIVGMPKAPRIAGHGGLALGPPPSPPPATPPPRSPASWASRTAAPNRRQGSTYSPRT